MCVCVDVHVLCSYTWDTGWVSEKSLAEVTGGTLDAGPHVLGTANERGSRGKRERLLWTLNCADVQSYWRDTTGRRVETAVVS